MHINLIRPATMINWLTKVLPVPNKTGRVRIADVSVENPMSKTDALNESIAHKKRGNEFLAQGRLDEAANCYRHAVSINPSHAEAHLNLGFVLNGQQLYEEAKSCLKQAIQLNPKMEDAYYVLGTIAQEQSNLGDAIENFNNALALKPDFEIVYRDLCLCLLQSGQQEAARHALEKGISAKPDSADLLYYLGNLFAEEKEPAQAIACYQRVLSLQHDNAEVHCLLGDIFKDQNNLNEAVAWYRKALALRPDYIDAHNNLGATLQKLGNLDEAMACYSMALALRPDSAEINNNLGVVFKEMGKLEEAAACYRKALALQPDSAETHSNLGVIFKDMGKLDEAAACYRKALELEPDFPEALNNLGNVFRELGHRDEAVVCYSKALQLKPDLAMANNNLGNLFLEQHKLDQAAACYRQVLASSPEFHQARINLLHISQHKCDWKDLEPGIEEVRRVVRELPPTIENKITPFCFLCLPGTTPLEQKICASKWAQSEYRSELSRSEQMGFAFKREHKSKLHIGYFSADLRNHPVAHLMTEVFELHDRDRFQITAYSYGVNDGSAVRKRLENAFDYFVDIRDFSDENAARKIYEDRTDILMDLTGYTHNTRSSILALRPAPVQAGYLGYLGTMGADFMDYIVADEFLIPPEDRQFYTEKVAYLPSYQANDRKCAIADAPSRQACGLPERAVVFCCFNQTYKILPDVFEVWMRLLSAVPGSVLWLYASAPHAVINLRREAQAGGVLPERLIFADTLPLDQHLARLQCADLFLDTLPYNAGTTASNALWAGLPVITCAGKTFSSRMAGSLLTALAVPELITYNLDDYYALALELARDRSLRENIRSKIIANRDRTPLFDSKLFTRNLEETYTKMWEAIQIVPH